MRMYINLYTPHRYIILIINDIISVNWNNFLGVYRDPQFTKLRFSIPINDWMSVTFRCIPEQILDVIYNTDIDIGNDVLCCLFKPKSNAFLQVFNLNSIEKLNYVEYLGFNIILNWQSIVNIEIKSF